MKVLNLYAGLGGNRKLWPDYCDVTAIEYDERIAEAYAANFPDDCVIVYDAHEALLDLMDQFDFIWSSPPCQTHSRLQCVSHSRHGEPGRLRRYPDARLWQEIIVLQQWARVPWAVENVNPYYSEFIPAVKVGRHLIWSNFHISGRSRFNVAGTNPAERTIAQMKRDYGLRLDGELYVGGAKDNRQVWRNCVEPEIGRFIFDCAFPGDLLNESPAALQV